MTEYPLYRLRGGRPDDARAIAEFQTAAWRDAYRGLVPDAYLARVTVDDRERRWSERLHGGHRQVVLAVGPNERLLGVASWAVRTEQGSIPALELATLYVAREMYGSGAASCLLDHAIGGRAAWLWVFEQNPRARAFYAKRGFVPNGDEQIDPDTGVPEVRLVRPALDLGSFTRRSEGHEPRPDSQVTASLYAVESMGTGERPLHHRCSYAGRMVDEDAFALHYRGAQLPGDALWWHAHPGSAGPSGKPDPELGVRMLRDRLFAPEAADEDRLAYAAAQAALATERAEVERALAAVATQEAAQRSAAVPALADASAEAPTTQGPTRRRRGPLLLGLGALVVIGAVAGAGLAASPHAPAQTRAVRIVPKSPAPWSLKAVSVPTKLTGEITRSTFDATGVHENSVDLPKLPNGVLIRVACAGPVGSSMKWTFVDETGATFGPSSSVACTGQVETDGDQIAYRTGKALAVSIDPSTGVRIGYAIVTRN